MSQAEWNCFFRRPVGILFSFPLPHDRVKVLQTPWLIFSKLTLQSPSSCWASNSWLRVISQIFFFVPLLPFYHLHLEGKRWLFSVSGCMAVGAASRCCQDAAGEHGLGAGHSSTAQTGPRSHLPRASFLLCPMATEGCTQGSYLPFWGIYLPSPASPAVAITSRWWGRCWGFQFLLKNFLLCSKTRLNLLLSVPLWSHPWPSWVSVTIPLLWRWDSFPMLWFPPKPDEQVLP